MQNILEWYENSNSSNEPERQVQQVSIEQELDKEQEKQEEQDNVLSNEYENVIKAIGITELLRNNLTSYLAMTQVPDLEAFKKDEMRAGLKHVLDELSNTIGEL